MVLGLPKTNEKENVWQREKGVREVVTLELVLKEYK